MQGLSTALASGKDVKLSSSFTVNSSLTIPADKEVTIDLNGKTITAETNIPFLVSEGATLNVKNGTITTKHVGTDYAWNKGAEIFYVGFNGTLNLDGVTARNLGGSDMAYVIDMVNATNITVNVKNSTLESTYIPIRIFNNMKNGVNNVAIKNSTLKGKYCFWVQYWLADGRDEATLEQTLKLDFFNSAEGESNGNTFVFANNYNAPVLYGFNEAVYFNEFGEEILLYTPIEGVEGVVLDSEGNYVIIADEGMASISALIAADENNFAGKTIILDTDIVGDVTLDMEVGRHVTIDGNGHKYNGTIVLDGNSGLSTDKSLIIKNVNVEVCISCDFFKCICF